MKRFSLSVGMVLLSFCAQSTEILSTRLEDSIGSNGSGTIDLTRSSTGDKIITTAELEAFRQDNGGILVLAVDVNEASNGTEKSESQGVTVDTVVLEVVKNGVTYTFNQFTTKTQTSVAEKGSTNRQMYYTFIGETGSSRITPSTEGDIYNSSFDATLSVPVDIDLSDATSVTLYIDLLDTNVQLGDPEAFYDYSAGFEDLAIVTYNDAVFLDDLAAGRSVAPLVVLTEENSSVGSFIYYPSSTGYYVVGYEDNYPEKGDYDFNDLVVGYQVKFGLDLNGRVKTIEGEGYLVARGGSYNHDWLLHIDLPDSAQVSGEVTLYDASNSNIMTGYPKSISETGRLLVEPYTDSQTLFSDPEEAYVNTLWYSDHVPGPKFTFSVTLDDGIPAHRLTDAPFDPILYVRETGYEIHLKDFSPLLVRSFNSEDGQTSFVDANGYPFAMVVPEDWLFPNEYVDLGDAYPSFVNYIESDNTDSSNWYEEGISTGITKHNRSKWKW